MLDVVKIRFAQVVELVRSNGWSSLLKKVVVLGRTAIVVEKDLSELAERPELHVSAKLKLVEIDKDMLSSGTYHFAVRSRYLKALNYVRHGYGGYALTRDNVVVGDTWHCVAESTDDPSILHEDLRRFGFKNWTKHHVYTFDIFVAPAERKGAISAIFQNNVMLALRSKGYTKAYGFYWADNARALACTRKINTWKEIRAFSVNQFLTFQKAVPLRGDCAVQKKQPSWLESMPVKVKKEFKHGRTISESKGRI
jgi:hypothetical protein